MRDLLHKHDVLNVFAQYLQELETHLKYFPRDSAVHNRIIAVKHLESRINLLSRGGLKVIEGGKNQGDKI